MGVGISSKCPVSKNQIFYIMKKIKVLVLALLASAAFASLTNVITVNFSKNAPLVINPGSGYGDLWKKTDSLANLGLTRSVLDVVKVIYDKAKKENNAPQFVKAVIYKLKFESYITEDDYVKAISDLTEEAKVAKYPVKPVMHSVLAEIYWRYYQQNRYKFLNRTETVDFVQEDVRTWDLRKIVDKVIENYKVSLENADSSKMIAIDLYNNILVTQPDSKKFRPTLYDFLAHRAVDFFMSEEPGLSRPADRFDMNNAIYYEDFDKFADEKITTTDTYALKYYAVLIFQDLLKFHMKDSNPEALVDVELKRLRFVRANTVLENADSLYINVLRNLEKKYISHPSSCEVTYEISSFWYTAGFRYNPLESDDNKWLLVKAYAIADEGSKRFSGSFGANNCEYMKARIKDKSLVFTAEEATVPDKPFRIYFSYRNLPEVHFRICKVDPQWNKKISRKYYGEDLVRQYIRLSPVKTFSVVLPDDKDYQNHAVEIKMPELPEGYYIILAATSKDFSISSNAVAYNDCWITDLSYIKRTDPDGFTQYQVLNRITGEPVKDANAQLYREKYNYTSREYEYIKGENYSTDENGMFTIPPKKDYNYAYYYLDIKSGNNQINTDPFYQYYYYDKVVTPVLKTVFFTDRAIYRPGQTIYFKGIMLETTEENTVIKPNFTTIVTLYDVNSQKVGDLTLTSNEYGTFDGTFTAPTGVLTGQMYISNLYGNVYFSVEEYKRPKFEVVFEPVKGSYKLGEQVTVKGNAKAYAGSNIDNADVKYRVVRTASFPYWWYYWWGYYPNSPQVEVINGTTKTDENGEFTINFKAIPDYSVNKNSCPIFNYAVYADVTDINGETRSSNTSVMASNTALALSVNTPGQIDKSDPGEFVISTTNLNGQIEHTKGTIEVFLLKGPDKVMRSRPWQRPDKNLMTKEEFSKDFPFDAYGDENEMSKYAKDKRVYNLVFDTGKDSILTFDDIKNWQLGYYVLEIKAHDIYGTEVSSYHYFTLFSKQSNECPLYTYDWFTTLKDKGEPGETASFLIASKDSAKVFYEIELRGKIIDKQWFTLNNQQKRVDIPIKEEYRGNFTVHFTFVRHGRLYKHDCVITVPYTNKELVIEYETFRNKLLPGEKEQWKIKISGKDGQKVAAEMLAGMYDASLDAYRANAWFLSIYNSYYSQLAWETTSSFASNGSQIYYYSWNPYSYYYQHYYDALNWFGFTYSYYGYYYDDYYDGDYAGWGDNGIVAADEVVSQTTVHKGAGGYKKAEMPAASGKSANRSLVLEEKEVTMGGEDGRNDNTRGPQAANGVEGIKTRTNFNETAFFYPHLETDDKGEIIISFTMPEALTKWKFMGLATTKDLKIGYTEKEIVTQKDLMIVTNPPRFLREGDQITFSAKITNLSPDTLCGEAHLYLFDALTNEPIDAKMKNIAISKLFEAPKGQSTEVSWDIEVPDGIQAITYKIYAKADNFTDGEEMVIPVLTNRMLVTETMPLPIRGKSVKEFNFAKLINSGNSSTLRHQKLTLEFTSNPAWYAIQALPYLMEYPYECAEQTFSRFYANSVASHIANSNPKIKAVFDSWKNETPDALLSNLEKNQELKSAMLEETPWVLEAKSESQRKRNVGILFDLVRMSGELEKALRKLEKMQCPNGGWPWFAGMPDDRYITQHIVTGMGHLDKLGIKDVKEDTKAWQCIKKGVEYLDNRTREDYEYLLRYYPGTMYENHLGYLQVQYLYARSYYMKRIGLADRNQKAFNYYKGQAQKYWLQNSRYMQGMIALALNRLDDPTTANNILKSLKENAIFSDEMGMYWKDMDNGYYWYQAPIETQALLIEAFDEVGNDQVTVEELKVWLLKQKQTQDWKTTKATVEACFALLLRGTEWLYNEPDVSIYVGGNEVDPKKIPDVKVEAGTGYFKTSWAANEIKPEMGNIKVIKRDDGVSWGAVYWQYFEQLDKITPAATPLQLEKKLFVERLTKTGPVIEPITSQTILKVGDKIKVRIELRVDRDMEYVQLKDMRASGFEPINVISQYKYQGGIGYYESTGDAATNFFISWLSKGTYVFEYPLRVTHKGNFSNGITSIQCMYAPEFASHSEGIRVTVQ
jgi:hypothetical protein